VELRGKIITPLESDDIIIFHFPIRTYKQFKNKISKGGQAYNNSQLPLHIGDAWRKLYKLYQQGTLESFYEQQILCKQSIMAKLSTGELIQDNRLKYAFNKGFKSI